MKIREPFENFSTINSITTLQNLIRRASSRGFNCFYFQYAYAVIVKNLLGIHFLKKEMPFRIAFLTLLGCCLTGLIKSENLEDPFLLPFGPKHGDQYATRDECSLVNNLDQSLKIGNTTVDKVHVCLDGYMKFSTPQEQFDPVVAPFLSGHRIETRFWTTGAPTQLKRIRFIARFL